MTRIKYLLLTAICLVCAQAYASRCSYIMWWDR